MWSDSSILRMKPDFFSLSKKSSNTRIHKNKTVVTLISRLSQLLQNQTESDRGQAVHRNNIFFPAARTQRPHFSHRGPCNGCKLERPARAVPTHHFTLHLRYATLLSHPHGHAHTHIQAERPRTKRAGPKLARRQTCRAPDKVRHEIYPRS